MEGVVPTELVDFSGSKRQRSSSGDAADVWLLTILSILGCLANIGWAMQFQSVIAVIATLG